MSSASKKLLICTVGGSHQPIVTAIEQTRPDFVCFVCSEDDPGTRQKGSYTQIETPGNCIKAHPGDDRSSLPNIPAQVGLAADRYKVLRVPADELEEATDRLVDYIRQRLQDPEQNWEIAADFTGGTKSMTASLVVASLAFPAVRLQMVTGPRTDLVRVRDQMQTVNEAPVQRLRLQQQMRLHVAAWSNHGYDIAANGLSSMEVPRQRDLQGKFYRMRDLSAAFAAWDRFDHARAAELLGLYGSAIGQLVSQRLGFLKSLNSTEEHRVDKGDPARLLDLWLNAQRRARQERYDDAVARCYRLWEWSAQWLLRRDHQIDTAKVPRDVAQSVMGRAEADDAAPIQVGLMDAWLLLAELGTGQEAQFMKDHRARLLDMTQHRNYSILAHGYTPISAEQWQTIASWSEGEFMPMLLQSMRQVKINLDLSQLQLPRDPEPYLSA